MISAPKRHAPLVGINTAMSIRYKTSILNPDGSVAKTRPWKNNLILDQGMNEIVNLGATWLWQVAAVGTGTTVVKRPGGGLTFARAGTTITASGTFFGSGDVGRLFKFNSGEEVYITAFTDVTHVETATSGTIASTGGTVWYVNQVGLVTESKRTQTYRTESGDNSTTFDGETLTHQRTFLFSAEGAGVTYTEIGWSWSMSAGNNLFGRDVIPGGGDTLITGQQYLVVVQMTTKVAPITPQAVSDVGSGGFNTAGTLMVESVEGALSAVASTGAPTWFNASDPGNTALEVSSNVQLTTMTCRAASATWSQRVTITTANVAQPAGTAKTLNSLGYTAGNFRLDFSGTFGVTEANGDIFGFTFYRTGGPSGIIISVKFTTTQTKANTHALTVTFRKSWSRTLVN